MMTTPDVLFERELEIFRTEEETVTQFFYAYEAVHNVAADQQQVRALLNQAPLFWNTCLGALQTASIIALGRVFDQSSEHNIDRVLGIAQKNLGIFSKSALGLRKQGNGPTRPVWLDDFLRDVYEPTAKDFRRLRAHINKRRKIYNSNYADLRHKWFAHKEVSDPEQAAELFGKTNIRELQKIFAFLGKLYRALWELFFNGRKPVLRPLRYSTRRMRDLPSPTSLQTTVQERITHEAQKFLLSAATGTQQTSPRAARKSGTRRGPQHHRS